MTVENIVADIYLILNIFYKDVLNLSCDKDIYWVRYLTVGK